MTGQQRSACWLVSIAIAAGPLILQPAVARDHPADAFGPPGFAIEVPGLPAWLGGPAVVEIYPSDSTAGGQADPRSEPGVARVSFAVRDDRGRRLGVYLELSSAELESGEWRVDLRGDQPTGPGIGVLRHQLEGTSLLVQRGRLTATLTASTLSGAFETDSQLLPSGTFHGSYSVSCFVAIEPPTGTLTRGARMWGRDSEFASSFCAPFAPAD